MTQNQSMMQSERYVGLESHEAVVRHAVCLVAEGESLLQIVGGGGLGKSTILQQIARRLRSPWRTVVCASGAAGKLPLLLELARALEPWSPVVDAPAAWETLVRASASLRLQERTLVIAVDDIPAQLAALLKALSTLGGPFAGSVHVVATSLPPSSTVTDGNLLPLRSLTRGEAIELIAKLHPEAFPGPAGRDRLTQLHALSRGVPRAVLRLVRKELASQSAVPGFRTYSGTEAA